MRKLIALVAAALMFSAASAQALPTLQVYIDGGTYDSQDQSWTTTSNHFDLWVIGNGDQEPIYKVYLATAFKTGEVGTVTFTPTHANGVTDPSLASAPILASSGVNDAPRDGNGDFLPPGGVYGTGTSWNSYLLGDFMAKDSAIADFSYGPPAPSDFNKTGQINAYTVDITGYSSVHFDAYDHYVANTTGKYNYRVAPYSHDAEAGSPVPEPGTMMLLGAGFLGLAIYGKRRQKA